MLAQGPGYDYSNRRNTRSLLPRPFILTLAIVLRSELLREAGEWEKHIQLERYYEPNFPVFRAEEREEL